jgi:hypothetical protein
MDLGLVCNKCNSNEFLIMNKGDQIGLYCRDNLHWIKWIKKKELYRFENCSNVKLCKQDDPLEQNNKSIKIANNNSFNPLYYNDVNKSTGNYKQKRALDLDADRHRLADCYILTINKNTGLSELHEITITHIERIEPEIVYFRGYDRVTGKIIKLTNIDSISYNSGLKAVKLYNINRGKL